MTVRERKLLRKQINYKLKYMANKESKENDFYNSSQIITERQQMYMTISKHFRTLDNRRRPNNLPFNVERTSLPHVNLSLLNRIYEATDNTLKSPDLTKVLNAHSYRTATPFYTNPELTVDRGKIMNYSAHVGTILHTPRYIEFLKNTPEYASAVKNQQSSGSEKRRRYSQTESFSSTTVLSSLSDSSCSKNETVSNRSSIRTNSNSINSSNSHLQRSKSSTIKLSNLKNSNEERATVPSKSSRRSSQRSSLKITNQQSYEDNIANEGFVSTEYDDDKKDGVSKSLSVTSQSRSTELIKENEDEHSISIEKPSNEIMNRQNAVEEDYMLMEEETLVSVSSSSIESLVNETTEPEHSSLISDCKYFFTNRKLEKQDLDYISRYYDTVDKYRYRNPDYVIEFGSFLAKNKLENFNEFQRIILLHQLKNISDENSKFIQDMIRNYEFEKSDVLNRRFSSDSFFNDERNYNEFIDNEPINNDPIINESINNKPINNEPINNKLINNERIKNEPINNEPINNEQINNEPINNEPINNEPINNEPINNEPINNESINNESINNEPINNETINNEPINNDPINNEPINNEPITEHVNDNTKSSSEETEDDVNQNILNTLRRVFPMDEIMDNYDVKIETEGNDDDLPNEIDENDNDEDFAEAFTTLFRNSITTMNNRDLENLKKLIEEYDKGNEASNEMIEEKSRDDFFNKFKDLFMTEKDQMSTNDIENLVRLINNESETGDDNKNQQFKSLFDEYSGQITDYEMEKAKMLINTEEQSRGRRPSDLDSFDDDEESEMMMSFRNLFRSSVGEIKKSDLEQIQRIITEHK